MRITNKEGKLHIGTGALLACLLVYVLWGSRNELHFIYTKATHTEQRLEAEHPGGGAEASP